MISHFQRVLTTGLNKRIHVKGKPNWIFIKIHGHGAGAIEKDREIMLGKSFDDMCEYLESKYNDGKKYFLHYVSARELYNIVRAAEDGKEGNPHVYRDFIVPRYVYCPKR